MKNDRVLEKMQDLIESMITSLPDDSLDGLLAELERMSERVADEILRRRWTS